MECLRRRDDRLDVVALEILLQVEDRQIVRLREAEELAERGIRLDRLLVRQLVVLRILHDSARDIRTADLRALGEAEENAELGRDLNRLGEDRRRVGLLLTISADSARLATTATLGLLLEAGDLLLHLLHLRRELIEGRAERVELDEERGEVGDDRLLSIGLSNYGDSRDNRRNDGYRCRRLGVGGGRVLDNRRRRRDSYRRGRSRGGLRGLGGLLDGGGGRGGGDGGHVITSARGRSGHT